MLISPNSEGINTQLKRSLEAGSADVAKGSGLTSTYVSNGSELVQLSKELLLGFYLTSRFVCLVGRPASGKSFITNKLMEVTDLVPLCTSTLIRERFADCPSILQTMTNGRLVDDDPVISLIRDRVTNTEELKQGFAIDGFPRTVTQANWLRNFARYDKSNEPIIIHLNLDEDTCRLRAQERAIAHHRSDDNMQIFERRLIEYKKFSAPTIETYRGKGIIVDVDCTGTKEQMWESAVLGIIDTLNAPLL